MSVLSSGFQLSTSQKKAYTQQNMSIWIILQHFDVVKSQEDKICSTVPRDSTKSYAVCKYSRLTSKFYRRSSNFANCECTIHFHLILFEKTNYKWKKEALLTVLGEIMNEFEGIHKTHVKLFSEFQYSLRKTVGKCHRFWIRLRHAVILISNDRTSASKKINGMVLIEL